MNKRKQPIICETCQSDDVRCTGSKIVTNHRVTYYKCNECNNTFKKAVDNSNAEQEADCNYK